MAASGNWLLDKFGDAAMILSLPGLGVVLNVFGVHSSSTVTSNTTGIVVNSLFYFGIGSLVARAWKRIGPGHD